VIVSLQMVAADTHVIQYKTAFLYNFSTFKSGELRIEPAAALPSWKNAAAIEADIAVPALP
jgi:hypothetical protein